MAGYLMDREVSRVWQHEEMDWIYMRCLQLGEVEPPNSSVAGACCIGHLWDNWRQCLESMHSTDMCVEGSGSHEEEASWVSRSDVDVRCEEGTEIGGGCSISRYVRVLARVERPTR